MYEYIPIFLSGGLGALIASLINILISYKNNKTTLLVNEKALTMQRELFKKSQEISRNDFIEKINFENRKSACVEFLRCMHPDRIEHYNFNISHIWKILFEIMIYFDSSYHSNAEDLFAAISYHNQDEVDEKHRDKHHSNVPSFYKEEYNALVKKTKQFLLIDELKNK
ncbi:hypothetical protein [uncultured Desulfovibrio sp.]|uniref:hypothetical protein n=1 Tax=uncultured Desulfovibrio sp. TaxID=167968 RepID=UPI00261D9EE0|nr:hypothetical protein [uncultured Desulfovibrio sp.]